jgi:hypothetical protein
MNFKSEEVINPKSSQPFLLPLSFENDENKDFLQQNNKNVSDGIDKNDVQNSMRVIPNTSTQNETQKLILQRLKMLELEESLIMGLMKEMKIKNQLLFHSLSFSPQTPLESEKENGQKKKERKKPSFKKDKDVDQQISSNFTLPFSVQSPFSSSLSSLSNQSFDSFNSIPISLSPSSSSKASKPTSRHVMIDNIMYNADADGCVYEDQPNHFPLLPTPSYKHLKSSLLTSDILLPDQTSPRFDSNVMGGKTIELEQLNSGNNYQCFNCGEKGHVYVIYIFFSAIFFFFFLICYIL